MLKKVGLPIIALAAMLVMFTPRSASAAARFGVYVGGPVYSAPAYPAYPDPYAYSDPYVDPYYAYPPPAPVYSYPSYRNYSGYGYRNGYRDNDRRDYRDHERHEYRERDRRDYRSRDYRDDGGRGYRR